MVEPSKTPDSTDEPTFEQLFERLNQVVRRLEEGKPGLDDSLRLYEEGVRALRLCRAKLSETERRVELLTGLDENGRPRTTPFEEPAGDGTLEGTLSSHENTPWRGEPTKPT